MNALLNNISYNWRRVLSWFKDDVFRRLFLNASKLLSATTISAILGFILTALTARALGPESYGFLALVLAYEQTVGKLVSFNAWQAVIKFGSERLQVNDQGGLRQLIKFGFCLDVGSAVAGTLLAMALAGPMIGLLGWDQALRPSLVLFSWLILFTLSGTPIGVLRLFDRFDLLSYTSIFGVVVRLIGVGWCLLTSQGLHGFVWVYLITGIVGQLYQVLASLWVLHKQDVGNFVTQSLHGVRHTFPGIWDYVWTTNVNSTIRLLSREADELIIAGLTTPRDLGLLKVAKQFSRILPMFSDPLAQSIFPEMSRLWAKGDKGSFVSLLKRSTLFTSVAGFLFWLGFVLVGQWVIVFTLGPDFLDGYVVTVVYMLAFIVFLSSFSVFPAMLTVGLVRQSFFSLLVATFAYFILLFVFIPVFGITGAAIAYLGFFVIDQSIKTFLLASRLRNTKENL